MSDRVIKAALLGLGTVGTGVYKVLKSQEEEMSAKVGCKVNHQNSCQKYRESCCKGKGSFRTH